MDRRAFVGAFAGSLVARYSRAEAQPAAKVYRISILTYATAEQYAPLLRELTDSGRSMARSTNCRRARHDTAYAPHAADAGIR